MPVGEILEGKIFATIGVIFVAGKGFMGTTLATGFGAGCLAFFGDKVSSTGAVCLAGGGGKVTLAIIIDLSGFGTSSSITA